MAGLSPDTLLTKCAGLTGESWPPAASRPRASPCWAWSGTWPSASAAGSGSAYDGEQLGTRTARLTARTGTSIRRASGHAEADLAIFREEVALAREAVAGHDLDATYVDRARGTLDVRWIYLHMIEEYARHNGHADLLRERIDGVTGDWRETAGR